MYWPSEFQGKSINLFRYQVHRRFGEWINSWVVIEICMQHFFQYDSPGMENKQSDQRESTLSKSIREHQHAYHLDSSLGSVTRNQIKVDHSGIISNPQCFNQLLNWSAPRDWFWRQFRHPQSDWLTQARWITSLSRPPSWDSHVKVLGLYLLTTHYFCICQLCTSTNSTVVNQNGVPVKDQVYQISPDEQACVEGKCVCNYYCRYCIDHT